MIYEIDAKPVGIFCSHLEMQWFCFLRQKMTQVSYVGHIDRWRDFVIEGVSVEVKPSAFSVDDIFDEVINRVPDGVHDLRLLIGSPAEYKFFHLNKNGQRKELTNGFS